jgi:hypothetical protein
MTVDKKKFYVEKTIWRSHFSCLVIDNFIWIEPLLRGHLSYKDTFSLSQRWPLNTGLTVYKCGIKKYSFFYSNKILKISFYIKVIIRKYSFFFSNKISKYFFGIYKKNCQLCDLTREVIILVLTIEYNCVVVDMKDQ